MRHESCQSFAVFSHYCCCSTYRMLTMLDVLLMSLFANSITTGGWGCGCFKNSKATIMVIQVRLGLFVVDSLVQFESSFGMKQRENSSLTFVLYYGYFLHSSFLPDYCCTSSGRVTKLLPLWRCHARLVWLRTGKGLCWLPSYGPFEGEKIRALVQPVW